MKVKYAAILIVLTLNNIKTSKAQIDEGQIGSWYMYFFDAKFKNGPLGVQGDLQYRNWNLMGDLEQLLMRSGLTYNPKSIDIKFTLGYAHIISGAFGSENSILFENRIYEEVIYPVKFGNRIYSNHRFRFEQRFIKNQNFRTRFRYNLFLNIPLNKSEMTSRTLYLALYNEIFINGQRNIGNKQKVEFFDRNRMYSGIGYILKDGLKFQLGLMNQTTNSWHKNQLQLSFHHTF